MEVKGWMEERCATRGALGVAHVPSLTIIHRWQEYLNDDNLRAAKDSVMAVCSDSRKWTMNQ